MSDYDRNQDVPVMQLVSDFNQNSNEIGFKLDVRDLSKEPFSLLSNKDKPYAVGVFPAGVNGAGPMLLSEFLAKSHLRADTLVGEEDAQEFDQARYDIDLSEVQLRQMIAVMADKPQENTEQLDRDFPEGDFALA